MGQLDVLVTYLDSSGPVVPKGVTVGRLKVSGVVGVVMRGGNKGVGTGESGEEMRK